MIIFSTAASRSGRSSGEGTRFQVTHTSPGIQTMMTPLPPEAVGQGQAEAASTQPPGWYSEVTLMERAQNRGLKKYSQISKVRLYPFEALRIFYTDLKMIYL